MHSQTPERGQTEKSEMPITPSTRRRLKAFAEYVEILEKRPYISKEFDRSIESIDCLTEGKNKTATTQALVQLTFPNPELLAIFVDYLKKTEVRPELLERLQLQQTEYESEIHMAAQSLKLQIRGHDVEFHYHSLDEQNPEQLPAQSLDRFVQFLLSPRYYERVVKPALVDMRGDHLEAINAGKPWVARKILFGYYLTVLKQLLQTPISIVANLIAIGLKLIS